MGCDYKSELFVGVPFEVEPVIISKTNYHEDTGEPYEIQIKSGGYDIFLIDTFDGSRTKLTSDKLSLIMNEWGDFEEYAIGGVEGLKVIKNYEQDDCWIGKYLARNEEGEYTKITNIQNTIYEVKDQINRFFDVVVYPALYSGLYVSC